MVVVGVAGGEVAGVVRGAGDDEGGEPDAEVAEVGGGVVDRGEAGGLALDGDGCGDGALDVNDLQEQRLNTGTAFEAGRDGRAGGVVIYALLGVEGDLDEFVFSEARRGDIGEAVAAFRTEANFRLALSGLSQSLLCPVDDLAGRHGAGGLGDDLPIADKEQRWDARYTERAGGGRFGVGVELKEAHLRLQRLRRGGELWGH